MEGRRRVVGDRPGEPCSLTGPSYSRATGRAGASDLPTASIHEKYGISGHHACSQEQYRNEAMSPTGTVRMLLTAGGIVVEEGGPLLHAVIVARELGLPSVFNVPGLLARLATQDPVWLRVDGGRGRVTILDISCDEEVESVMGVAV